MMSACLNSGKVVMSVPVLAMSTMKRLCFLNWLAFQMTIRSHTNCQIFHKDLFSPTTVILEVCLSRTSILACMPLFRRASIKRLAAMAAPPVLSDVFIINTLMVLCKVYAKVLFFMGICFFPSVFYAPKSPFNVRLMRRMAFAQKELVRA